MKKTTRLLAALLAVVMLVPSLLVPGYADASFTDVKAGSWYEEAVNYVTEKGFMNGVGDGKFAPNQAVTRAMFVTVLARMFDDVRGEYANTFEDVPDGKWYTEAVAWAAAQGITNGVSATMFAPNKSITRQDMCTMLARYLNGAGLELAKGEEKTFTDADKISGYAKDAVALCSSAGLILGNEDGSFQPAATATRAQLAIILMRLDKALHPAEEPVVDPTEPDVTEPDPTEPDVTEPDPTEPDVTEPAPTEPDANTVTFSAAAGDLNVNVAAPETALPANASMVVSVINSKQQLDEIAEKANGKVLAAVDISFHDITGEIEPDDSVEVTLTKAGLDASTVRVVHIKDDGTLEGVNNVTAEPNAVKFHASDFSVYAIIGDQPTDPRATVNFYNGETLIATVYVKEADTREDLNEIVFDPGTGTLGNQQIFKGWTTTQNYTLDTPALTIDGIRDALFAENITENITINYYAIIAKYYNITYYGESEDDTVNVSLGSESVFLPVSETEASYTVNMAYTPPSGAQNFEGWMASTGGTNIVGWSEGNLYPNGTEITITGNIIFSVEAPFGHWLVFKQNGDGATYIAPQFVKSGEVTAKPTIPILRLGYTFGGWYTDEACTAGNEFTFGSQLADDTTVYAKWTQHTTADYAIIVWKQNINGDGYDYDPEHSVTLTGNVNSTVNTVSQQGGTGNNAYARINGTNVQYTGFHLKEFDQNVTIAPEGNTILNVYYDRNEYTLHFQINGQYSTFTATTNNNGTQYGLVDGVYVELTRENSGSLFNPNYYWTCYTYTPTTSDTGTQYGVVDSQYAQIYYRNGAWRLTNNNNGEVYTGTRYTRSTSQSTYTGTRYSRSTQNGWHDIKTITALYEQPIGDHFPIVGTNGITYNSGERWMPQNSGLFNNVIVFLEVMPAETITFRLNTANYNTKTMVYYVESLAGDSVDSTFNGKNFTLYNTIYANLNYVDRNLDWVDLIGYEKFGTNPAFPDNGRLFYGQTGTVNFYYTRKVYSINFMDGSYYDGNGNRLTNQVSMSQVGEVDGIPYLSDISSYNSYQPSEDKVPTGFVFEGWYTNKECTNAYNFTTMPDGGITVYAKWRQIQYRVFLHPEAGTDPTLDWGDDSQQMNFRISYGGFVSTPTGLRGQYEFIDWFTAPEGGSLFNAELIPLTEQNVTTDYDKSEYTDYMDKWGNIGPNPENPDAPPYNSDLTGNNGGDRWWITKKLDLYARWRKVLDGAQGINVIYNVGAGGIGSVTDSILYKDQATAIAQSAATPRDPSTTQFLYWIVQKWNGTDWENTDVHVYPGGGFTVLADDAQTTNVEYGTDGKITSATYTIQLLAAYGPLQAPKPSHIYWYANNGTNGVQRDENLQINKEDPIPTPGNWRNDNENATSAELKNGEKQFLGWARISTESTEGNEVFNKDGLTGADLFLRWIPDDSTDGGHYEAQDKSNNWVPVTYVACDENTPYHDLYAVWSSCYYIYHASTGDLEAVELPANSDATVYLPALVSPNSYYGGWFTKCHVLDDGVVTFEHMLAAEAKIKVGAKEHITDLVYDGTNRFTDGAAMYESMYTESEGAYTLIPNARRVWVASEAGNQPGDALKPVAGTVYYLREIPKAYFSNKALFIYNLETEAVEDLYMISAADDKATYEEFKLVQAAPDATADIGSGTVPEGTYNLCGTINGNDNSYSDPFVDGKLTVTFTQDSYVAIAKYGDGAWFMTNGWQGKYVNSVTLRQDYGEASNKLFVPANVKLTFTLTQGENGSLNLSYVADDGMVKPDATFDMTAAASVAYAHPAVGQNHGEWESVSETYYPETLFGNTVKGYVLIAHVSGVKANDEFKFIPQWKTLDGVTLQGSPIIVKIGSTVGGSEPAIPTNNSALSTRTPGKSATNGHIVRKIVDDEILEEYIIELPGNYTVTGLN